MQPATPRTEKDIFQYFDGVLAVYGDPLAIERRMEEHLGQPIAQALQETKAAEISLSRRAEDRLFAAVREAFEMAPWYKQTGEGATEKDCRLAFKALVDFIKKKS